MFDVDTPTDCLAVVKQFYPCPTHKLDINTTWPDIEEHLLPADQRDLHEEVAVGSLLDLQGRLFQNPLQLGN